jgi:hypothetical protein
VASRVGFQSYERLNERYASITSTPQATRTVVNDLGSRTRKRLARWGIGDTTNLYVPPSPETDARGGHFTLPHIDMPKIDLPHVDLGSSDSGGGGDSDGGGIVLLIILIVVAIIALCLGAITTWVIISRVAGQAEPLPSAAPSRA